MRQERAPRINSPHPLHARIAADLEKLIGQGVLRPGDKLPSLRRASRQHKVSITTAVHAYLTLENRGLVQAIPKSGFVVRSAPRAMSSKLPSPRPAPRIPIGRRQRLVWQVLEAASRPDIVQFGAAFVSTDFLPVEKLNRILGSSARRAGASALQYEMPPGCATLRRALARRALDWGINVSPEEIIITTGCMEALTISLRAVTKPGDTVAVESPTFFGTLQALDQLGLHPLELPTSIRHGLDIDALERAVRSKMIAACIVNPNFNNPCGGLMPSAAKERLVGLLSSHEIPLIEDDLYGDLAFGSDRPHVAKAYDSKELVILCGSFSKTVAPGYRVGWMIPGRYFDKALNIKFSNTVATATAPQLALAEYVQNGGYDHHIRGLRQSLRKHVREMTRFIKESFPTDTAMSSPQGGFLLWVELPKYVDSLRVHAQALARKISIAPGPMFSSRLQFSNCIRMNCGQPWSARLEEAISTLGRIVRGSA